VGETFSFTGFAYTVATPRRGADPADGVRIFWDFAARCDSGPSMGARRFFALQCTVAHALCFATACPQLLDDDFDRAAGAGGSVGNAGTSGGGSMAGSGSNSGAAGAASAEAGAAAVPSLPPDAGDAPDVADAAADDGGAPVPMPCPQGALGPGATCYYLATSPVIWSDASQACLDAGRLLVQIDSAEEDAFIATLSPWSVWIGASDTVVDGTFVWTDGSSILFSNWGLAQPDAYAGPDCVEKREGDELWYDQPCDIPKRYVCESPAPPP
jgi:hypothetical protein